MEVECEATDSKRSSAFAHVLNICVVLFDLSRLGEHVVHVGIVDVLGIADGSEGLEVKERSHLEVEAGLDAVVFFLDTCHAEVGERVRVVVVEVLPLCNVVEAAIVCIDVGVHPGILILIAELTAEHMLVAKVEHVVVADLRRDKCSVGHWWTPLVAYTNLEDVALAGIRHCPGVAAIGDFGVAQIAMTTHVGLTELAADHSLETSHLSCVGSPEQALHHLNLIVITELVAFVNERAEVVGSCCVEVVLHSWVIGRIGAERISVDVVEEGSTEQVVHGLIVTVAVAAQYQSAYESRALGNLSRQGGSHVDHQVVAVFGLDEVECIMALVGSLSVGIIESLPVNLAVGLACCPVVVRVVPALECRRVVAQRVSIPDVVVAAWQVLPVVRLRILCIGIVELGALVHRVLAKDRGGELHLVVDVPVPCGDG